MKALSIKQPWAWLIVNGYKDVENRCWPTNQRGKILIHAGKSIDREGLAYVKREFPRIPLPETFETGGIVGEVDIVDCIKPGSQIKSPWYAGDFGFVLRNAVPLPFKPCKGQLGFFEVN